MYQYFFKRLIDFFAAFFGLLLLSPLLLMVIHRCVVGCDAAFY
jgi:lipopolysaccharide/colanic/teichoic acid biosynthesis glycosyltransferase